MPTSGASVLVHGSCVNLGRACGPFGAEIDAAALLLGDSGSGKSDLTLRLIVLGARLIADDQTVLFEESGRLFASAPPNSRNWMEIRGIGLVQVPVAKPSAVLVAVELVRDAVPRFPEPGNYRPDGINLAVPPKLFRLDAFNPSTPAKIAAVAAALHAGTLMPPDGTFF
jgi:hypothetical protein